MNETNEKKKGRFNVFDALLILLVLAVVGAGLYYFWQKSAAPADGVPADGTVTLQYTVVYRYVPDYYNIRINEGDAVFLTSTKEAAGTIESYRIVNPSSHSGYDLESGIFQESDNPGTVDVFVNIRSAVRNTGAGYMIGNETVAIGNDIPLRTKLFAREAYVIDLKEVPSK